MRLVHCLTLALFSLLADGAAAHRVRSNHDVIQSQPAENTTNAVLSRAADAEDARLRERLADVERRNQILEARSELEDKAFSQFQLVMAGLGGVITLLVVGFGIFTHRSAVMAARQEISDLKDKVRGLHDEAAVAMAEALSAANTAKEAAAGAQTHQRTAQEASEKVREAALLAGRLSPSAESDESELSPDEKQKVSEAAKEIEEKSEAEWNADEFRVKIAQANSEKNWREMLRISRGMEFLHGSDPESLAYALLQDARALVELGHSDEAMATYDRVITEYRDNVDPKLQELVARAMLSKGFLYGVLGKNDEAIATYDDLIETFREIKESPVQSLVAKSELNRGVRLIRKGQLSDGLIACNKLIEQYANRDILDFRDTVGRCMLNRASIYYIQKRFADAIAAFEEVISLARDEDAPEFRTLIVKARFGIARVLARQAKVKACIETLNRWKVDAGTFDCQAIADHKDFNAIRGRPFFVRYLRQQGCSV
jgi:tetratricopeptide (TPR) repeat protein